VLYEGTVKGKRIVAGGDSAMPLSSKELNGILPLT
jgi:hypothetical protein